MNAPEAVGEAKVSTRNPCFPPVVAAPVLVGVRRGARLEVVAVSVGEVEVGVVGGSEDASVRDC